MANSNTDDMNAFFRRGRDDRFGRHPDALIDDVHAGVARADRDLLGAVGMAVEAGFADQEFHPSAELLRYPVNLGADAVEARSIVPRRRSDAGWGAVFAERRA